jgi:hypothetical protein
MAKITMSNVTIELVDGKVFFNDIITNYRFAFGEDAVDLSLEQRNELGHFDFTVWFDVGIETTVVNHYHSKTYKFGDEYMIKAIRDIYTHHIHLKAQQEIDKLKKK